MRYFIVLLGLACFVSIPSVSARAVERLILRLDSRAEVVAEGGRLFSRSGEDIGPLRRWLATVPHLGFQRALSLPEERVERLRQRAIKTSVRPVPDPNAYFVLTVEADQPVARLLREAETIPLVERIYQVPPLAPPPADVPPTTPDLEARQRYLGPPPVGINARAVWTELDVRGEGVTIADVEYAWRYGHEEWNDIPILRRGGTPYDPFGDSVEHGTAVLGELMAPNNGYGVTGIAHASSVMTIPECPRETLDFFGECGAGARADAILLAAQELSAGDILLLEMQTFAPATEASCESAYLEDFGGTFWGLLPVEFYDLERDAILLAVQNGIVVVEAAGNGGCNLDSEEFEGRFSEASDTGAIMVGAGASSRVALNFSNYGSRVDVQGWGTGVATAGYGGRSGNGPCDLHPTSDPRQYYTGCFGGTSSASPIVAGACALIQSHYESQSRSRLASREMRELLVNTGLPDAGARHIGPQPDVLAALTEEDGGDDDGGGGCGTTAIPPRGPDFALLCLVLFLGLWWQKRRLRRRRSTVRPQCELL